MQEHDVDSLLGSQGQLSYGEIRYQPRLHIATCSSDIGGRVASSANTARPGAPTSWLVTGGGGALGLLTATWLTADSEYNHVVLSTRSGRLAASSASATHPGDAAAFSGACVTVARADVGSCEEAAAVADSAASWSPAIGLLHASGTLMDATLGNQSLHHVRSTFAPKANALSALASRLNLLPLPQRLLFSSIAAVTGPAGSTSYAAANAALDQAAAASRRIGAPASSIQWGAWAGVGMVAGNTAVLGRMRRAGISTVAPAAGLEVMAAVLGAAAPATSISAVPFLWPTFLNIAANQRQPFFSNFLQFLQSKQSSTCGLHERGSIPIDSQGDATALRPSAAAAAVSEAQLQQKGPTLDPAHVTAVVATAVAAALGEGVPSDAALLQAGLN